MSTDLEIPQHLTDSERRVWWQFAQFDHVLPYEHRYILILLQAISELRHKVDSK